MNAKRILAILVVLTCVSAVLLATPAAAENCMTTGDMDGSTRSNIEQTALRLYQATAAGDVMSLRNNAIPALSGNFGGIERAVADNKDAFTGAQPSVYSTYILDATGGEPTLAQAMFVCGVYNSQNRIQFSIPNLPAGKYAFVVIDANGSKGPYWLSLILQEQGPGQWKLAGFYPKSRRVGDKGPGQFLISARDYRAKGELHNAYFYYLTARDLSLPVSFMMTRPIEKLDSEAEPIVPKDIPGDQPATIASPTGKSYQVTQIFPVPVGTGMNLVIKYKALGEVSDTRSRFTDNMDLMKAFAARYPEYRGAFAGFVARAVDPATGQDYGTVLAMNDIR